MSVAFNCVLRIGTFPKNRNKLQCVDLTKKIPAMSLTL